MKKIKFLVMLISLVLAVALLASCGGDECKHTNIGKDGVCTECGEQVKEPDVTENEGEIVLVEGGVPKFHIVTSISNPDVVREIDDFITKINGLLTADAKRVADTASTEQDVEIIIGSVKNRGDAYKIDEHYLGHKGYAVKAIDNKIVLYAGIEDEYASALKWLEKEILGISKSTKKLDKVVVDKSNSDLFVENITEYPISVSINGSPLSDYVFAYDTSDLDLTMTMKEVTLAYYKSFGSWCDTVKLSKLEEGTKAIIIKTVANDGQSGGLYSYVDGDGNLVIECMYPEKMAEAASEVLINHIASTTRNLNIKEGAVKSANYRDIYYADFGAKGDGKTDDFKAIRACHEYANKWGHTVHADGSKSYYLGIENGDESIFIGTDTYWHGATFILDDSESTPDIPGWRTPRFKVMSEHDMVTYLGDKLPVTSLRSGADNIGFAPGHKALVVIWNERQIIYKRSGSLEDGGDKLHELVMVDENGNIDPKTPLQWDYTEVTRIEVVNVEDAPITISGGEGDTQAVFETIYFQNLTETILGYTAGDIKIMRSNVTIKNIYHKVTDELLPDETSHFGVSYDGFTNTSYSNNVTFENLTLYRYNLAAYSTTHRSYEITATLDNNITWRNCNMSNFFDVDGSVRSNGMMGTNYSKNMAFDNVEFNTFDAHRGSYNVTIENSTLAYISIIGAGKLTVRNTDFYTTRHSDTTHAIWLRADYGSTFWGDVEIDGVDLIYAERRYMDGDKVVKLGKLSEISLIDAQTSNHDYGYVCTLPYNISINNVRMVKIDYGVENGVRWEEEISVNEDPLWLFPRFISQYKGDLSSDDKPCPLKAPLTVTITNCQNLFWNLPYLSSDMFDNTVFTIDGKVAARLS